MGIAGGADCAAAAGHPNVYCVAGGDRAHAAAQVSRLYVYRVVAVVFCSRLCRNEVGGAREQRSETEDMVPSHGWCDPRGADRRDCVFRVVALEGPGAGELDSGLVSPFVHPNLLIVSR